MFPFYCVFMGRELHIPPKFITEGTSLKAEVNILMKKYNYVFSYPLTKVVGISLSCVDFCTSFYSI